VSQQGCCPLPKKRLEITAAIEIKEIFKSYTIPRSISKIIRHPFEFKHIEVLKGVSLTVRSGSITGLLGPNGAGKSTLLRILAATISPDKGRVHILGQDVTRHATRVRKQIGFVLGDERSFFWRLNAKQNLKFFATLSDIPRRNINARITELTEMLKIEGELEKPFRDLSTGMRQRLAIARALLHDPDVLLFDEPTRGLDPGAAVRTQKTIREMLAKKLNKTVLLATHNIEEAKELTDHLAFLKDGIIIKEGQTAEMMPYIPEVFDLEKM
jgi:ABC-2 type transport system ATP-binding protein